MRKYDGLLSLVSVVLIISISVGLGSALAGAGFSEPDNPLGTKADPLVPEALDKGGNFAGSDEGEQEETVPPEETEPEETEPEETEPEKTEPEESRREETEPQPTTKPEEAEQRDSPDSVDPTNESTDPEQEPSDDAEGSESVDNSDPVDQTDDSIADPEQGPGDNVGGTEADQDNSGHGDSDEDGEGLAGDDEEGDGEEGDVPGEDNDDALKIVTDLRSQQVTRIELPDGIFKFYAYPSKDDDAFSIKVVMNNSTTPANGRVLTGTDDINYEASLMLNETNIFTLYLKEDEKNISYVRYYIRYEREKADEDNPEVGDNPPSIITNLDDFTGLMETQGFLLWVSARTNPDGKPIYSNHIEVWLNGELIPKHSGDSRPEYELYFEPPNVGDYATYTVKVRAWDGKGNSTMKVYTINYHTVSEGDYLGEVEIVLDATTVGLGIVDETTYEIFQGDTVADVVIKFLDEYGYDATYDGSANVGFYLRKIERGDLCRGAKVPEKLWKAILRDGITLTQGPHRDILGEHDYTIGSGWMYSINGSVYPERGMSNYRLSNGMTINIRFTLAYGKDIGGYDATGSGYGSLSSYCGVWINDGYTPLEHDFEETDRVEATETEDGYIEYTCSKCRETKREVIPMTGEPTVPEETVPEETVPEETVPEETEPEEGNSPTTHHTDLQKSVFLAYLQVSFLWHRSNCAF